MIPMPDLSKLGSVQWVGIVNRNETPILRSISDCVRCSPMQAEVTGLPWQNTMSVFLNNDVMMPVSEKDLLVKAVHAQPLNFFPVFEKKAFAACKEFLTITAKITKTDYSRHTAGQLLDEYTQFEHVAKKASCFLMPMPLMDTVLSEKVNDILKSKGVKADQWNNYRIVFAFSAKENTHAEEMRSILSLSLAVSLRPKDKTRI